MLSILKSFSFLSKQIEKVGCFMKTSFLMTFLAIVVGLATGFLLIDNELELMKRMILLVILVLAATILMVLIYKNDKLEKNNQKY